MDNRTRVLQQAVSVDGWIGSFDGDGKASVHVDIVFRNGSFGEDPSSAVRFKIALRRAEVIVRVPSDAPLKVIKRSIARTVASGEATESVTKAIAANGRVAVEGDLSLTGGNAKASVSGELARTDAKNLDYTRTVKCFMEQHFTTPDNHPAFELATDTRISAHLNGSPWDAVSQPRLQVQKGDAGPDRSVSVIIEVRCAREDIEIIDLEEKDPERRMQFLRKHNKAVNLAAAEQIIKQELCKAGFLDVPDLGEKYARLLIADKIILEE